MASVDTLNSPQYIAPSAADGVALAPSTGWGNTAYVELLAAADADLILTGICPAIVSNPGIHLVEFDVAVGAPSSEVVIATFRFDNQAGLAGQHGQYVPTVIGIDAIPNGSRISTRARALKLGFSSGPYSYRVAVSYLKKPLIGTLLTTTQPLLCTSLSGAHITLTPGVSWVDGAWVTVVASTAAQWALVGASWRGAAAGIEYEMDLGVGAPGSEVVIATLPSAMNGIDSYPNYQALHNPLSAIPAGSRVAARARTSSPDTPSFRVTRLTSLAYFEFPL